VKIYDNEATAALQFNYQKDLQQAKRKGKRNQQEITQILAR
jgi:hypothetical protein